MKEDRQPITMLKAAEQPRAIADDNLEGLGVSMEDFGDLSGIVWNERTGELVCGNQRMTALRNAGVREWTRTGTKAGFVVHPTSGEVFPIRIVDWPDSFATAAAISANNPELQGEFTDGLAEELHKLEEEAHFAELNLAKLLAEVEPEPKERERQGLEEFESAPAPKRAWILIATNEADAAEIEADLRARYDDRRARIEVSIGSR